MGAYHLNEDGQRLLLGIVPDGFFDAHHTYAYIAVLNKTELPNAI